MESVLIVFFSWLLGASGAWWMSRYAGRFGLLDSPTERSSHDRSTPKGGGIGILLAFSTVSLVCGLPFLFWLPSIVLSVLSFFGDRVDLSPKLRLSAQFTAAVTVLLGLGIASNSGFISILLAPLISLFIVGTANFYNFMDGINGIAGITAVVGFGLLGFFGISTGQESEWLVLTFALAASCFGFLPFNIPVAKIFMGDVGSVLLGFVFASLVVVFSRTPAEFIILCSFLFPFYIDELTCMMERIWRRERLMEPHRSHFYQVLANEAGIAHWKVSAGYGVTQLVVGLLSWSLVEQQIWLGLLFLIIVSIIFIVVNTRVKNRYQPC